MKKCVVGLVLLLLGYLNLIETAPQYENEIYENGYHFQYSTNDSAREERGELVENAGKKSIRVNGFYEYTGLDGNSIRVFYQADENEIVYSKTTKVPSPPFSIKPPSSSYANGTFAGQSFGIHGKLIDILIGGNTIEDSRKS